MNTPIPAGNSIGTEKLDANFNSIAKQLELVKLKISGQLVSSNNKLSQLVEHITQHSGKMVRPTLFLLSSACFKEVGQLQINVAAVLEMIHIATLLHDDVIDMATTRRNMQTVNSLYGNERAVLLGDFVLANAFQISSRLSRTDIQAELASMTSEICQGELLQNLNRANFKLSEEQYIDIISKKTASFFATACKLAAIINNIPGSHADSLQKFGLNIGIAFQIRDDIIDITGKESLAGKTLGSDIENFKLTLPLIHYLKNCPISESSEEITKMLSGQDIASVLGKSGSIDYTRQKLAMYIDTACGSLELIPDSQPKDELIKLAKSLSA